MNTKTKAITIIVTAAVVFSVFAFAVPFPKNMGFWIAYIFEIVAFILQIPVFKIAFDKRETLTGRFFGFPVFRVGYIYLGIQTALSLAIFILGFIPAPAWLALILCIIVTAGAVICSISADIARDEAERIEYARQTNTAFMTQLRSRAATLSAKADSIEVKKALERLAEDIRFSDPVSSPAFADEEQNLLRAFDELEKAIASEQAEEMIQKVTTALVERNAACKARK